MIHLRSVARRPSDSALDDVFPFNIPIIRSFEQMEFSSPVTFFVGENGSGKSTLLEVLACAVESISIGSQNLKFDTSLEAQRTLAKYFRLSWTKRTHRGFYLRAEDFFGYARRLAQMRNDMETDLQQIAAEYKHRSAYASSLAKMSTQGGLSALKQRYGDGGLDAKSHGESFLALFQSRFVPGGLYLLDEPEAPLSPLRQLSFIALLKNMVVSDAQFIIATHSPILMAFPGAVIFDFQDGVIHSAAYEDLEHVRLTRDFLQNPAAFIEHL